VLGAGGIAGAVWLNAVLAGIEETTGIDVRRAECIVGTSAGSIVGARLCAGRRPRAPQPPASTGGTAGHDASPADHPADWWSALGSAAAPVVEPFLPLAYAATAPGSALARRLLLSIAPRGQREHHDVIREIDRLSPRFDGRLRICCVERSSGRRVVFGAPGAPDATVTEAVAASCSIPGMYRPVRIGGREYVDGGAWSPTNLDVAVVARGTRVLCLNPLGSIGVGPGSARSALGGAVRLAAGVEAALLRRRGATVQTIVPDAACAAAMGTDFMSPGIGEAVAPVAYAQGLATGRRAAA
jgi:NTE family protein